MAKLRNAQPTDSKRTYRYFLGSSVESINLKDLMNEIDKQIPGITPGSLGHYFFRIRRIDVEAGKPGHNFFKFRAFGREYSSYTLSNKGRAEASVAPQGNEWWGLWHDSQVLEALGDKGATTALNEIEIFHNVATTDELLTYIVVDFVPKTK